MLRHSFSDPLFFDIKFSNAGADRSPIGEQAPALYDLDPGIRREERNLVKRSLDSAIAFCNYRR